LSDTLEQRLARSLSGSPLAARLATVGSPFFECAAHHGALEGLGDDALRGLARVLASSGETARYLSSRPELIERFARADADTLDARTLELEALEVPADPDDLELYLDAIRLARRDETVLAGCVQLAGTVPFERVSDFLSTVAETCVRWALHAAERPSTPLLAVLGMGKIAGREFTYQSDLDLIFLYADAVSDVTRPARVAQRLISHLTSMTAAGVAYAVDSRLRPSGRQGALVSTFESFARYQHEHAATWEHLALMRARTVAGDIESGQRVLSQVRDDVVSGGQTPWQDVALIRRRVERERGRENGQAIAFKAGRGGLMDIEFLAAGSLLERGRTLASELPSIPAMLRATLRGSSLDELLESYALLRRVEACARWLMGRAVESFATSGDTPGLIAELVEPGLGAGALLARVEAARSTARSAWDRVIEAGSVDALSD
jgi:glutamate-ammonia-ligase adenylyltransferase